MFIFSYSATIVALLQTPSSKIKTVEDLLGSRLKFGVDDTVFNRYYFSVSNSLVVFHSSPIQLISSCSTKQKPQDVQSTNKRCSTRTVQ